MKITCTGRKVNLKDAFIQRVETKLAKLDKFFSDSAEANVTVTVEKDWQTVEVTVKDKGFTSRAEKSADRMEDAFDAAVDLLTRQAFGKPCLSARGGGIRACRPRGGAGRSIQHHPRKTLFLQAKHRG